VQAPDHPNRRESPEVRHELIYVPHRRDRKSCQSHQRAGNPAQQNQQPETGTRSCADQPAKRPDERAARPHRWLEDPVAKITGEQRREGGILVSVTATGDAHQRDAHRFLEVTYASGEKETLYFKDFVSGAMIESVCTRAKKTAVKRMITTGVKGITAADLVEAVKAEFRENEDLPNTTNPDDWAKIAGRRGERIVHVRPVFDREAKKPRKVENISTGHYL